MTQQSFRHRPETLDAFLDEVDGQAGGPAATAAPPDVPWDAARSDVQKTFNLRLPEKHLLMLRYIAAHTPDSMQTFCQKHVLPAIEAKIAELTQHDV